MEPPAENLSLFQRDPPASHHSLSPPRPPPLLPAPTPTKEYGDAPSVGESLYSYTSTGDAPSVGCSVRSGESLCRESRPVLSQGADSNDKESMMTQWLNQSVVPSRVVRFADQLLGRWGAEDEFAAAHGNKSFRTVDKNRGAGRLGRGYGLGTRNNSGNGIKKDRDGIDHTSNSHGTNSTLRTLRFSKRIHQFKHLKESAGLLFILAIGMMVFIGGYMNSGLTSIYTSEASVRASDSANHSAGRNNEQKKESIRGLIAGTSGSEEYKGATPNQGIMEDFHPKPALKGDDFAEDDFLKGKVDWNKVPPHLRGFYSNLFRSPPQLPQDNLLKQTEKEYHQTYDVDAAKAIQSIGNEAVLGFRGPTIDFSEFQKQQDVINDSKEPPNSSNNNASTENDTKNTANSQSTSVETVKAVEDEEEMRRKEAADAALAKAATAEVDAQRKRQEELTRLRAAADLSAQAAAKEEARLNQQRQDEEKARQQEIAFQAAKEEEVRKQLEKQKEQQMEEENRRKKEEEKKKEKVITNDTSLKTAVSGKVEAEKSHNAPQSILSEWRDEMSKKLYERVQNHSPVTDQTQDGEGPIEVIPSMMEGLNEKQQGESAKSAPAQVQPLPEAPAALADWRNEMKLKLAQRIKEEKLQMDTPSSKQQDLLDRASLKLNQMEEAESAIENGDETVSLDVLQKEISELLSLMGGKSS